MASVETPRTLGPKEVGEPPDDPTRVVEQVQDPSEPIRYERGHRLGRYVVLEELGSGGMSVVYGAYDPELDRKVAIKVLLHETGNRAGWPSGTGRSSGARLVREAQTLARLSHPNVLPVFDVGTIDDRVFIAMEYVDGHNLSQWLKDEPRPWQRVLDAFLQAGRGLAAAHSEGFIHRDFKPHNVMVGKDSSVRVMDFGLVRLSDDESVPSCDVYAPRTREICGPSVLSEALTGLHDVLGTVPYMAPEQQRGSSVSAAVDQYAFCVALYQGLYGQRPFASGSPGQVLADKESLALAPLQSHRNVPRWVRRTILRGLSPHPDHRWPSMDALLQALDRNPRRSFFRAFLAAVAVAAALGGGWAYGHDRQGRATLCTGGPLRVAQAWNDTLQEQIARSFARTELAYADQSWQRVSVRLDEYTAEWQAMHESACEATHLRREQSLSDLDLRMACLDARLREVRALTTVLARADAEVVRNAAKAVSKLSPIKSCRDPDRLRTKVRPPPAELESAVEDLRNRLAEAAALEAAGKFSEGLLLAEALLTEARDLEYGPLVAEVQFRLGWLQYQLGQTDAAIKSFSEAAWVAKAHRHDEFAARSHVALVFVVGYAQRQRDKALLWLGHARASFARLGGNDDLEAELYNVMGALHSAQEEWETARPYYRRALELRIRASGEDHLQTGSAYINLANSLDDMDETIELHHKGLQVLERQSGPQHPTVGGALINLGEALLTIGDYDSARTHLERALTILEAAHGPEHPHVGFAAANLAKTQLSMGEVEAAEVSMRRALSVQQTLFGSSHPVVVSFQLELFAILGAQDRWNDAESVLEHVQRTLDTLSHSDPLLVSGIAHAQGKLHHAKGRFAQAIQAYERAMAVLPPSTEDHWRRFSALVGLGQSYLATQRWRRAVETLEQALRLPLRNAKVARAKVHFLLAQALLESTDDPALSRAHAQQALEGYAASSRHSEAKRDEIQRWMRDHLR